MDDYRKTAVDLDGLNDQLVGEQRLGALVANLVEDATNYVEEELKPARERATNYYLGKPFGNEEEGRSQVVMTEVRDGVLAWLPSMLRVIFGPERLLEFTSRNEEQAQAARDATDAVHDVFAVRNPGFMLTHSVLKDGLVRKIGIFKWGMDVETTEETEEVPVPAEAASAAAAELSQQGLQVSVAEGENGEAILTATRTVEKKRVWVDSVPPEEFIFDRNARSLQDALYVGHRRELTRGELIAMGIPAEVLDEHGTSDDPSDDAEETARRAAAGEPDDFGVGGTQEDPEAGEANENILYTEGFARLDLDGDGIAELLKVCTIGVGHYVVKAEPASRPNFAIYCPDPEPHTVIGQSLADRLMDLQLWKSSLVRGANDSLSLSLFPRIGYVENQVSVQDLMNTEIGSPIRMKRPDAITQIKHEFVGAEALNLANYVDATNQRRTGRDLGTAGLDANALQSSTREGVTNVIQTSQEQIELATRIFVEQTLKPLFQGLAELLMTGHPEPLPVRVQGRLRRVVPGSWDPSMDLHVNAALGTGHLDKRVNQLKEILAKQESLIQQLGLANPLVSLQQYRHTITRILEAQGFHDASMFFAEVPENWQPPAPNPDQKSPEQALAEATIEAEKIKTEKELEIKEAEFAMKREESQRRLQLEEQKAREDLALRREDMMLRYQTQVAIAQLTAESAGAKAALDAVLKKTEMATKAEQEGEKLNAELDMHEDTLEVEREKAQLQAETAKKVAAARPKRGEGEE